MGLLDMLTGGGGQTAPQQPAEGILSPQAKALAFLSGGPQGLLQAMQQAPMQSLQMQALQMDLQKRQQEMQQQQQQNKAVFGRDITWTNSMDPQKYPLGPDFKGGLLEGASPKEGNLARAMGPGKAAEFFGDRLFPKREPFSLSPGQIRYDEAGRPITQAPHAPFSLSPGQTQYDPQGRPIASSPRDPMSVPSGNRVFDPNTGKVALDATEDKSKVFDREKALRGEFQKLESEYKVVDTAYQRMQEAANNPSPAGDLTLVYSFAKLQDPGSVVRESEFATVAAAGGLGERVQGYISKLMGEGQLTPEMRRQLVTEAGSLYNVQKRAYEAVRGQYDTLSRAYGLKPENILSPTSGAPSTPATEAPPIKGDFDSLRRKYLP